MKTMMVCMLAAAFGVFLLSGTAGTAEEASSHPIDAEYQKRIDVDSSTMGMIEASQWASSEWDRLLNENYAALMAALDGERREKLRASQREWLKYRDLDFAFNADFWAGFDGSMYRVFPFGFQADFIRERALRLGRYLEEWKAQGPEISLAAGPILKDDIDTAIQTIRVANSREFLEALGSDRIIEMEPGRYNLSEWDPILNGKPGENPPYPNLQNEGSPKLPEGVSWTDTYNDGGELTLKGMKNLTIRGLGEDITDTGIVIDPRSATVLQFWNCGTIVIEKLTLGHTRGSSECDDGVLGFKNSSGIIIAETGIYGCGTWGLRFWNVSDVKVSDSIVYDCTHSIAVVINGKNIAFEKCVFRDNGNGSSYANLVRVFEPGTETVSFTDCEFTGNRGAMFFVEDATVSVSKSTFQGNETGKPIQDSDNVVFVDCEFESGGL